MSWVENSHRPPVACPVFKCLFHPLNPSLTLIRSWKDISGVWLSPRSLIISPRYILYLEHIYPDSLIPDLPRHPHPSPNIMSSSFFLINNLLSPVRTGPVHMSVGPSTGPEAHLRRNPTVLPPAAINCSSASVRAS